MDYETWPQSFPQKMRDKLVHGGMSKDDATWAACLLWTSLEQPRIRSLEQYKAAATAYEQMEKEAPRDNFRSPAAIRLDALGGALIEFEEEYELEHGELPPAR